MRRFLVALAGLAFLLLAADSALWFWASGQLLAHWQGWVAAEQAAGWRIATGAPRRGGWPLRATLILPNPRITGGEAYLPGGIAWQAARLTLELAPAHWRQLWVIPAGPQTLALAGHPAAGIAAGRLHLDLPLHPLPHDPDATLAGAALQLRLGTLQLEIGQVQAALWMRPTRWLTLKASRIVPPPGPGRALAPNIAALALQVAPDGPLPATLTRAGLAGWRQAGGSLAFSHIALNWGPLRADGATRLGVDAALQPTAAARVTLHGWRQALQLLAAHHAIRPEAALAAGAVLGLLARPGPDGGGAVDLPLSLRARQIQLGHIPLARLPAIDWPGP